MGQKKQRRVQNHTPGSVRYFTYHLEFPDGDIWRDQIPFVHPIDFELKQTRWPAYEPNIHRDLIAKGEARFTDQNGVKHIIIVEDVKRPKHWGTRSGAHKFMV